MSPISNAITDQESEIKNRPRGRRPASRAQILDAANTAFAKAQSPKTLTMDALGVAAGVGKGTLFRHFGSRDGLLDALWDARLSELRATFENAPLPEEPSVAFLQALLRLKLANRHLIHARETAPDLLKSPLYLWVHRMLAGFLATSRTDMPDQIRHYLAHVLLGAVHIELVEDLLESGMALEAIFAAQAAHLRAIIAGDW